MKACLPADDPALVDVGFIAAVGLVQARVLMKRILVVLIETVDRVCKEHCVVRLKDEKRKLDAINSSSVSRDFSIIR